MAVLGLLGGRWPSAGVRVADTLARLTGGLGFGIAPEWLTTVFPELTPDALRAARRRTWAAFLKGTALEAGVARVGRRAYPRLVHDPAFAALEPPVILASMHVGPFQAIGAALRLLPGAKLAVTRGQYEQPADVKVMAGGEDEWARARTFHHALTTLREGGSVLITVDAFTPGEYDVSSIEAPMLGGTVSLARGAFALARVSGVPIRPLVARWRGTQLELSVGEAISPALGEEAMAAATARWVERYLRERPGEISVFLLERLRPPAHR